jgi:ketosteroid isomerase-like protein
MRMLLSILTIAALSGCMTNVQQAEQDSAAAPLAAVHAFHDALVRGDEAAARQALAPDVLIYESGGAETSLEHYASHHMKSDMAFMKDMKIQALEEKETVSRDLALVTSRSRMTGQYRGKALDLFSTQTMALKRGAGGWRIVHIHWSSQPAGKSH